MQGQRARAIVARGGQLCEEGALFRGNHDGVDTRPPPLHAAKLIPKYRYSNHHLPRSLQYEAWHQMVLPVLELKAPDHPQEGFASEIVAWDLGRIAMTRSATPAAGFHRKPMHIRNSGLDHWCFAAIKTGTIQTVRADRITKVDPGGLFIKSLHAPLEGTQAENAMLCVFVPRDFCRERVGAIDAADETVLSSGLGRLLASYFINLDRQLRWMSSDELPAVLAATRAMIDACVAPTPDGLAAASIPINATLLERAREMVQKNLQSPSLNVDSICREMGISRSRLYRLFEELGGVVHYIRSRRLLDAHKVLSDGKDNRPIVDIAAERDFLDPADFSRAFKREFGYSPTDARIKNRQPSQQPPAQTDQDGSLGDLLNRLH